MELLERDAPLDCLTAALASATTGVGRVALVSGGAGLGKTTLVRAFLGGLKRGAAALVGACDDLSTPRPLGPLHDIARGCRPAPAEALARGDVPAVYTALLDELAGGAPTVVVVEDFHWADEATLDALTFLSRRVDRLPVLLVLTYREDEGASAAPLQRVLGGLHAPRLCGSSCDRCPRRRWRGWQVSRAGGCGCTPRRAATRSTSPSCSRPRRKGSPHR